MIRRSPEFTPTDPTQEAIRDELPRDVLSYAEGLRREMYSISRRYGVEKPADIGPKIASGEVSLADMERMIELKKALEKAVAERRIPFRMEAYRDALREFAEEFLKEDSSHWRAAVERLPMVPQDQLLSRETFLQDVVDAIGSNLPKEKREVVWPAVARIVARAVKTMLPEVRERITQVIRADGMKLIGHRWSCGTLVVLGMDGGWLGYEMSGGTIRAGAAADNAALNMKGGVLEITGGPPIGYLGFGMEGGEIRAFAGGDCVGKDMKGGTITLKTAGDSLGASMTGGTIEADKALEYVGDKMAGGTIRVRTAIGVGPGMRDGRIEVAGMVQSAGREMVGGTILVENADFAGTSMRDGTIIVTGVTKVAGLHMSGGTILVRGTADEIVPIGVSLTRSRSGGTIRYEGPWAWWKNLFVK